MLRGTLRKGAFGQHCECLTFSQTTSPERDKALPEAGGLSAAAIAQILGANSG